MPTSTKLIAARKRFKEARRRRPCNKASLDPRLSDGRLASSSRIGDRPGVAITERGVAQLSIFSDSGRSLANIPSSGHGPGGELSGIATWLFTSSDLTVPKAGAWN
jgi:hypothetical protein